MKTHSCDSLDSKEYKDYAIEIHMDDESGEELDPRTSCDNLGTMACFHSRYNLGDKEHDVPAPNYYGDDETMEDYIWKEMKAAVVLPLFLYDHSGITISTGRNACDYGGWDTSSIGYTFVTKAKLRKEYGVKRISKKLLAKAEKILRIEVDEYDKYIRHDIYKVVIMSPEDENGEREEVDSRYGFFVDDSKEHFAQRFDEMFAEGQELVDADIVEKEAQAKIDKETVLNKNQLQLELA